MKRTLLLISLSSLISASAMAAIAPKTKNALRNNTAILRGAGAVHGGLAGQGFSLLGIKTQIARDHKMERLSVAVGDANFQAKQGAPGYFHIENTPKSKRVVINFDQTLNAKFDEKNLKQALAKSPFVQNSQMHFDPETQTLSLILQLKRDASLRVIPVNGSKNQTAQLNIDLFDDSLIKKAAKK